MALLGLINYKRSRSEYKKNKSQRAQRYQAYLDKHHRALAELANQQRRASLIPNPAPEECLHRAETRSSRLWERKPSDPDFLEIRLGVGPAAGTFEVKPPVFVDITRDPDDLFEAASSLATSFKKVDGVAINLALSSVVTAGLIGQRQALITSVRAMLVQMATHHAPSEVKLVLLIPEAEAEEWAWARWLPHTWDDDRQVRFIADNDASTHRILNSLEQLLKQRKHQRGQSLTSVAPTPAVVFVFAEPRIWKGERAVVYGPILELLLKEGAALGAYSIFLAEDQVPKDCGAVVNLDKEAGTLRLIGPAPKSYGFKPDTVDADLADRFARSLAPLRLEKIGDNSGELPTVMPLLEMLKVDKAENLSIAELWHLSRFEKSLAVPIGIRSGNKVLYLDLHERAHGPHALLAGTSGSGKSEFLQTLITSLALRYPPEKVAFILIDFKALMVPPFKALPHQVGIITNLDGGLAVRALIGLDAEKERRQRLFLQTGKSSIDDYQELYFSGKVPEPLPHLFIIVDEFAELAVDQPDFIQGLVSLSQVGRSLGIHLLLATQKPAGVVNETIWANSHARICLRVERPEDSQDVLKRTDAAAITAQQKGRAYLQVGMNEIFEPFQVAWSGAPCNEEPGSAAVEIASRVALDGSRRPLLEAPDRPAGTSSQKFQIDAIVEQIILTRNQQPGAKPLKRPWLEPLEKVVYLKDYRSTNDGWDGQKWQKVDRWMSPIVGVFDNPAGQTRGNLALPIGKEGHLAIFGAPGSGETTLLQTIIMSLIQDHPPSNLHLYILDFGGRSFKAFEPLPHVGAIVTPDESERVHRLLQFLRGELDRRKKLLEPFGGKINDYRSQQHGQLAEIVVILDNYSAFKATFYDQINDLTRIAGEGASFGIHLILTANVFSEVTPALSANIGMVIALELNDPNEYKSVVGRTNGILPTRGVPGRGLIKGTPPLEFQTALAAENPAELKTLVDAMCAAWSSGCASHIPSLEDAVPLSKLLTPTSLWSESRPEKLGVPVGQDLGTPSLEPFTVDLLNGPHFWVAGPPQSGKTTLLQTWLLALAEQYPPQSLRYYLVDMGNSNLSAISHLPHVQSYIVNSEQLEAALAEIHNHLEQRASELKRSKSTSTDSHAGSTRLPYPALVMVIDDIDLVRQESSEESRTVLHNMMRRKGLGLHVLAAGIYQNFGVFGYSDNLNNVFKETQTGFLIGHNNYDDLQYIPVKLSHVDAQKCLPPGTAFYVQRGGRYHLVQLATCHHGKPDLQEWVASIANKRVAEM